MNEYLGEIIAAASALLVAVLGFWVKDRISTRETGEASRQKVLQSYFDRMDQIEDINRDLRRENTDLGREVVRLEGEINRLQHDLERLGGDG